MTRLRAAAAAVLLLMIVAAVPAALGAWGVSPATLGDLTRPDDGSALLAALTVVGWLAWLAFTSSVVVEAVNLIGRRAVPLRIPLLGGLQSIAGALVFAALSSVVAPATAMAHGPTPTATATTGEADPVPAGSVPGAGEAEPDGYLVRPGDDLWSVAEQLLGQGNRWRLIAEANPGLLANPTVDLTAGTRLVIPDLPDAEPARERAHRSSAAPARPAASTARLVTVQRGDTLSGLAQEHLGAAGRWPRIYRANTERIKDPDLIDIGWKLVIPANPAAAKPKPARTRPVRKPVRLPDASGPQTQQPAPGQPAETPETTGPAPDRAQAAPASDPSWPLIGGLSGAAAAMILAGLNVGRISQLRVRPVGRRISHPPLDVRRYETALGRRERPETTELLERALRALGAHAHATAAPLPRPGRITIDGRAVTFGWLDDPAGDPPDGFRRTPQGWRLTRAAAERLPASSHPVPFPALVTIGRDAEDNWVMVDLESRSPLALQGSRALQHAAAAAMAVELSCSPWASELSLTVVGGDEMFI
ncbi:MAG TPA: LysM peptidoglycan-binding domain-containing protein, partial [Micropruina sp.]|nr:LysM peptidoglycan-binding domain-containing protein [Micropruina sp.]